MHSRKAVVMLLLLIAMFACENDGPGPNAVMDADWLRTIVVEAHSEFRRRGTYILEKRPTAKCSGDRLAMGSIPASKVRGWLEDLVTGPARQCYFISYLGCGIEDRLARSGVTEAGPEFGPYNRSKVVIVQQTKNRIVADVAEVQSRLISVSGDLYSDDDPSIASEPLIEKTSRYTLTRDSKGHWRIYDRKPNFEWECRVR